MIVSPLGDRMKNWDIIPLLQAAEGLQLLRLLLPTQLASDESDGPMGDIHNGKECCYGGYGNVHIACWHGYLIAQDGSHQSMFRASCITLVLVYSASLGTSVNIGDHSVREQNLAVLSHVQKASGTLLILHETAARLLLHTSYKSRCLQFQNT